ncbi:MAG: type III polyketide synthase [Acidobacteria bacterium]|nr:type III polyketide synthase [Acidobacteriota bacterium]MCZ6832131.1 type III polyketide synthase [Acidobacteriota bacterium]
MKIAAVSTAFPPHYYDQQTILAALSKRWTGAGDGSGLALVERLHRNVKVQGRHLALPIAEYDQISTWGQANDAWIRVATDLGEAALRGALDRAGLEPKDVDAILFCSITGISTPSIDAKLVNRLRLPARVKRMPLFGLGCVAGAAGLARAADYVRAFPDQVAVLVTVELCSLTLQSEVRSVPNFIASGLFGDGAAAAVVTGAAREAQGPRILATRSVFYPDSEDVMGWKVSEKGFGIVLSADVPNVVRNHLCTDVDAFLSDQKLSRDDIKTWVCHPGGPRVLQAMQESLELPADALAVTWDSLNRVGNLSSASVLVVLEEVLRKHLPAPGSHGLLMAMGPGFCSELVLLQW